MKELKRSILGSILFAFIIWSIFYCWLSAFVDDCKHSLSELEQSMDRIEQVMDEKYDNSRKQLYDIEKSLEDLIVLLRTPRLGQIAEIKIGITIHESSRNFGSGKSVITADNSWFLPEDKVVLINGLSYLDDEGNITSSFYKTYEEVKEQTMSNIIDHNSNYMLHVCTSERDLGWVFPDALNLVN